MSFYGQDCFDAADKNVRGGTYPANASIEVPFCEYVLILTCEQPALTFIAARIYLLTALSVFSLSDLVWREIRIRPNVKYASS